MPQIAPPPPFDPVVAAGIGGLAWLIAGAVLWIWRRHAPATAGRATIAVLAWLTCTGALAASGVLARLDLRPPPAMLLIVAVLGVAIGFGLSRTGGTLAAAVPLVTLIGLQVIRLPLELVMHRAADRGIMPPALSYGGYNFDIVTGAVALVLVLAMKAGLTVPRGVVWAWNVWGLWCLGVIVAVAVASAPIVRAFGDDPRHINTWVLHLPYIWLPTVLVVVALAGHVIVTRALLSARRA